MCTLNPPVLTPKLKPVVETSEIKNVVVVGASKNAKRDDSILYAFDSENKEIEPACSREFKVKTSSTVSTTKDILQNRLDPDQEPDNIDQDYVYNRLSIALHLCYFLGEMENGK